jgi:hypothetical protein
LLTGQHTKLMTALHGPWRTAVPVTLGLYTRMRVDLTTWRTRHWQRLEKLLESEGNRHIAEPRPA